MAVYGLVDGEVEEEEGAHQELIDKDGMHALLVRATGDGHRLNCRRRRPVRGRGLQVIAVKGEEANKDAKEKEKEEETVPYMGGTKRLVANLSLLRSMQSAHGDRS